MRTQLYNGSRRSTVDTRSDVCLYSTPRPLRYSEAIQRQGKDLYLHTDREETVTYYLHLWSTSKAIKDKILPVSPARNGSSWGRTWSVISSQEAIPSGRSTAGVMGLPKSSDLLPAFFYLPSKIQHVHSSFLPGPPWSTGRRVGSSPEERAGRVNQPQQKNDSLVLKNDPDRGRGLSGFQRTPRLAD
jgi:hypothetical protein